MDNPHLHDFLHTIRALIQYLFDHVKREAPWQPKSLPSASGYQNQARPVVGRILLFDLTKDIVEQQNLADAPPDLSRQ